MPLMLLTGLGFFKSLLKKYWKFVLVIVAVLVLLFVHQHYVHAYGDAQFKRGVDATLTKIKTEVAKRNDVNRVVEERVDAGLNEYAAQKARQDEIRHAAEIKAQNKIADAVDSVPMWQSVECAVTPQVLIDRNAIRALGPKEETK